MLLQVSCAAIRCWRQAVQLPALLLSLATAGCLTSRAEASKPETNLQVTGGVTGAVVDLGSLLWTPGMAVYDLPVAGQGTRSVAVWVPPAAAPRALILLLQGRSDGSAARGRDPLALSRALLRCLAVPALASLEPLLIAPGSPAGQWWTHSETELVLGLVLAVRERWPQAGDHSVIAGYSNGGIGSWYFARLYPEYFRAAIPIAFNDGIVGETPLPVYAIMGTKDEQFEFPRVRRAIEGLRSKGGDVTLDEKYRGSHHDPCSYLPELTRAGRWLEQHVFSDPASLP